MTQAGATPPAGGAPGRGGTSRCGNERIPAFENRDPKQADRFCDACKSARWDEQATATFRVAPRVADRRITVMNLRNTPLAGLCESPVDLKRPDIPGMRCGRDSVVAPPGRTSLPMRGVRRTDITRPTPRPCNR